jgi:glutaredoxin-related protein
MIYKKIIFPNAGILMRDFWNVNHDFESVNFVTKNLKNFKKFYNSKN